VSLYIFERSENVWVPRAGLSRAKPLPEAEQFCIFKKQLMDLIFKKKIKC